METVYTSSPSAGTHNHDDEDDEGGLKTSIMPRYVALDNLVRPDGWSNKRIDVTVITSGLFRDLYSTQSILMDNAFRVALARSYYTIINNDTLMSSEFGVDMKTALNEIMDGINYYGIGRESFDENYVAKHWVEDFIYFRSLGYDVSTSGEYAITRIFAPPNGDYGAGISKAVQLSWTWNDTNDLAEFYLGRMGNMYSKNYWGESNPLVFANALNRTNKIIVSRNTNQYGVLDNDDFFDYWGGLSLAIKNVTGSEPEMSVLEYANTKEPYIASLEKVLNNELSTRYLNPSWIKGMMGEGYSGARYISNKFSSNLLGWSVTRDSTVNNWMWDSVYNTYVNDGYNIGVTDWLQSGNNAYSFISTTGTLLTAAYEGYWKTDANTLSNVANKWAQTVIQNGVACCDCSCGNIAMLQWAINYINPDMLQQFKQQMFQATHNNVFAPDSSSNPNDVINQGSVVSNSSNSKDAQSSNAGSSVGEYMSSVGSEGADAGSGDVYEVNTNPSNSNSVTGMSIPALLAVMAIVAIIALGFYRRKGNKEDDY